MSDATQTHWRKIVSKDNPHLTVWDIEGKTPLAVTIEATEMQSVYAVGIGDDDDQQPAQPADGSKPPVKPSSRKDMLFLRFKGCKKALGVCATNASIIEAWHGPHIEGWIGKQITLRTAVCKRELCIRVAVKDGTRLDRRFPRFNYTDKAGA